MSDDLILPTVPEPKPEDPEDVSWALSTAEAMWARGDHLEGIKWVRRAAEAASEAENDGRALELAKSAADLAGLLSRRTSRASIDLEEAVPISVDASVAVPPPPPPAPPKKPPPPKPMAAAPAPVAAPPAPVAAPPAPIASPPPSTPAPGLGQAKSPAGPKSPSRPPAPLPSRTSQPPPPKGKPVAANNARPPSLRPGAVAAATKGPESKRDGGKKGRRSRENLDNEARAAAALADTAKQPAAAPPTPLVVENLSADTTETAAIMIPIVPDRPRRARAEDPTTISHVNDVRPPKREADEWDADMTQNLTGDDFPLFPDEGDRMTAVGLPPADFKSTLQSFPRPAAGAKAEPAPLGVSAGGTNPPATVAAIVQPGIGLPTPAAFAPPAPRPAAIEPHDPKITTSQAVRVVVWRDANGVHVAPAGTVVSAITVDAVLVALEPNADLTAWLTQRGR